VNFQEALNRLELEQNLACNDEIRTVRRPDFDLVKPDADRDLIVYWESLLPQAMHETRPVRALQQSWSEARMNVKRARENAFRQLAALIFT